MNSNVAENKEEFKNSDINDSAIATKEKEEEISFKSDASEMIDSIESDTVTDNNDTSATASNTETVTPEDNPAYNAETENKESAKNAEASDDEDKVNIAENDKEQVPCSKKKKLKAVILAIVCAVLIVTACFGALIAFGIMPSESELGKPLYLPARDTFPINLLIKVKSDLSEIDTDTLGKHPIVVSILGVADVKTSVSITDRTAPIVELSEFTVPAGTVPEACDLVLHMEDKSSFNTTLVGTPDSNGNIKIKATDEYNNSKTYKTKLYFTDKLSNITIELGEELVIPNLENPDTSKVNLKKAGTYAIKGTIDNKPALLYLTIKDTTAPTAIGASLDIIKGYTPDISEFIKEMHDGSHVTLSYENEPDFSVIGEQSFNIILTDDYGNSTTVKANVYVHDLPDTITIEVGDNSTLLALKIFDYVGQDAFFPRFSGAIATENLEIGYTPLYLNGRYGIFRIRLSVVDTTAPVLELKELTIYRGFKIEPSALVEKCTDASKVTYSFKETPDFDTVGKQTVTVSAVDEYQNVTEASVILNVIEDRAAPIIYGTRDIEIYEGDSISYKSGVYAYDGKDGYVNVRVNSSKVNTSKAGKYSVTYSAYDREYNTAYQTITVTVKPVNLNVVNSKVDKILAELINAKMTEREKARAIYDWCRKYIKYSTTTSHLMGYYNKAAYSGLTKYYGNCYTYYAVSSAMLTRAGIYNIEIKRNDINRPHYWNLVKLDGKWYHFDTCPQPSPHKLEVFLLTDSQLAEFTLDYYYKYNKSAYPQVAK